AGGGGGQGSGYVDGAALGAVHGARVAQFGGLVHVLGGEVDGSLVGESGGGDRAVVVDALHRPGVAVLHAVPGAVDGEGAVHAPGHHDVSDPGVVAVTKRAARAEVDLPACDPAFLGEAVQLGDPHVGVGHHERFASGGVVGVPGTNDLVDEILVSARVDSAGGLVPADIALPEGEGGLGLGGVARAGGVAEA